MPDSAHIAVEVACAMPTAQHLLRVALPVGSTLADAINASGIADQLQGLLIDDQNVGIFSRPARLDSVLADGDRVEIYRPLIRDPKDTRRLRARQQKRRR